MKVTKITKKKLIAKINENNQELTKKSLITKNNQK